MSKTELQFSHPLTPISRQPNKVFIRRERERERGTLVKRGEEYLRRLGLRLTAMAKTTSRWGFGNAGNVRTRGGSGKCKESDNAAAVLCPYSFTCEPILILILILILIFYFVCLLRREFKSKQ